MNVGMKTIERQDINMWQSSRGRCVWGRTAGITIQPKLGQSDMEVHDDKL